MYTHQMARVPARFTPSFRLSANNQSSYPFDLEQRKGFSTNCQCAKICYLYFLPLPRTERNVDLCQCQKHHLNDVHVHLASCNKQLWLKAHRISHLSMALANEARHGHDSERKSPIDCMPSWVSTTRQVKVKAQSLIINRPQSPI